MMPGSKGLNPHELAHRWVKDLGTRPDMSIKVGYDYKKLSTDCSKSAALFFSFPGYPQSLPPDKTL